MTTIHLPAGFAPSSIVGSPDGQHWAAIGEVDGGEAVVLDGRRSEIFETVWTPQFQGNGQMVCVVERDDESFVLHDDQLEGPYEAVNQLTAGAATYGYLVRGAKNKTAVHVDGKLVDTYASADHLTAGRDDGLIWSADLKGKKGLTAELKGKIAICRDGSVVTAAPGAQYPQEAARGEVVYLRGTAKRFELVRGATVVASHDGILRFGLSPDGTRLAWLAKDAARWSVMDEQGARGTYDDADRIAIANDGSIAASVVKDGRSYVVTATRELGPFDRVSTVSVGDGGKVAFVAFDDQGELQVGVNDQLVAYQGAGQVEVLADGRVAYAAKDPGGWRLVVDGAAASASFDRVSDPTLCGGKVVAFAIRGEQVERLELPA